MKICIQRVSYAKVDVDGKTVGSIGRGLLVLVGIVPGDNESDISLMARKCVNLRIFDDENGVMNLSVKNIGGEILAVSQFTLAASIRKGNRPSYIGAASPAVASVAFTAFCKALEQELGHKIERGVFGADMKVNLLNDGPVTIIADSEAL